MDNWYVGEDGKQRGPLSLDEVVAAARSSGAERTYVWREGFAEWKFAADVPEIAAQLRTAPAMPSPRSMAPMPTGQGRSVRGGVSHPVEVFAQGSGKGLSLSQAVRSCFGKYATFKGRAPRSEYWYWTLFVVLVVMIAIIVDTVLLAATGAWPYVLTLLFGAAVLLPGLSVTVRRLHDIDFTGWWFWICIVPFGTIVLLVFHLMKGTTGPNNYGEDPLGD